MIYVKEIQQTCGACPAQWEGETDTHERVYVRYRWGVLRVDINDRTVFQEFLGEDQDDEKVLEEYKESGMDEKLLATMAVSFKNMREIADGDPVCYDGSLSYQELKKATQHLIVWP